MTDLEAILRIKDALSSKRHRFRNPALREALELAVVALKEREEFSQRTDLVLKKLNALYQTCNTEWSHMSIYRVDPPIMINGVTNLGYFVSKISDEVKKILRR